MKTRLIIDGNAVYEIDEECLERRRRRQEEGYRGRSPKGQGMRQNRESEEGKRDRKD